MPNYETGKVTNVNALMQTHLDYGGQLELVVQRDGKQVLDFIPGNELTEETKED